MVQLPAVPARLYSTTDEPPFTDAVHETVRVVPAATTLTLVGRLGNSAVFTTVGASTTALSPFPNCPYVLFPQQYTPPAVVRAHT